jgi:hypothetical protein
MTSGEFDLETANRLAAIRSNPNPRSWRGRIMASIAWGKKLDREAAMDSFRNVLAVIGAGAVLADFGTMRLWLAAPCLAAFVLTWYADYLRHF